MPRVQIGEASGQRDHAFVGNRLVGVFQEGAHELPQRLGVQGQRRQIVGQRQHQRDLRSPGFAETLGFGRQHGRYGRGRHRRMAAAAEKLQLPDPFRATLRRLPHFRQGWQVQTESGV